MNQLRALLARFAGIFRRARSEREFSTELEAHLELHIAENLRAGMLPDEARRQALLRLGGLEQTKEIHRDRRGMAHLEAWLRDLRYAARVLRKNFGFSCIVIFTLALGIGANTAIFSVLESQLWRPLPFPNSERLVDLHVVVRERPRQWDILTNAVYRAWAEQSRTLTNLGAYNFPSPRNLTAGGTSERELVMALTASALNTLEVPLGRGRNFLPEEETAGRDRVVILSDALWQTRFGSDVDIIGKPITIDGEPYTIVGIASPRLQFEFLPEPAIYIPLVTDPRAKSGRGLYAIGRLRSGATAEGARAELDGILQRGQLAESAGQEDIAAASNLRETWTNYAARPLYFFAGAILLVLLIACVNNAGLLLARGLARQREFALRATLGASRATLLRQSLAESLLLSIAGGAAGTLLGLWCSGTFAAFWSEDALPRRTDTSLDVRVLLFVVGASILSSVIMGALPALFSSRVDVNETLRKGAGGLSAGRTQQRTRGVLVAVEVSLALVLLFGAGLFLSSFIRLEQAPRGFDAPGALSFRIALRGESYAKPEQQQRYFDTLRDQLRAITGVNSVTFGSSIPLQGSSINTSVSVAGRPRRTKYGTGVMLYAVEPNFFDVLHMQSLAGRKLDSHDTQSSQRVAVINRNAVRTLFGAEDPLGKVLEFPPADQRRVTEPPDAPVQIVGVAENVQEFGANEVPFDVIYIPFAQHPDRQGTFVVSAAVPRAALLGTIRDAAYALDKDQPLFDIKTVDDRIADSVRGARFNVLLVACLATVALALVSVGIFGTVTYFVQQRTQEFGIRLALGATPGHILGQAIGRAGKLGGAGVACGVGVALILGRILRSAMYLVPHEHTGMLYGVKIYDPLSMTVAAAVLLAVLLLASFIPARRAMRVDPMVALRYE